MNTENFSIDDAEIQHFAKDSSHWWDEEGPFRPLHLMNPVRLEYIRDQIKNHFSLPTGQDRPLSGLSILDIGCGGGLVCEPLTRLGATVSGIDADKNAIAVAKEHAAQMGLDIHYREGAAESLSETFDVVLALEIIEHVKDVPAFVKAVTSLCKPDGLIIFSTLNRTPKSFALGIVAAEYILRWVPQGTHKWKKFIRPSEMAKILRQEKCPPSDIKGLVFDPLTSAFKISETDIDVNYFITATKESC